MDFAVEIVPCRVYYLVVSMTPELQLEVSHDGVEGNRDLLLPLCDAYLQVSDKPDLMVEAVVVVVEGRVADDLKCDALSIASYLEQERAVCQFPSSLAGIVDHDSSHDCLTVAVAFVGLLVEQLMVVFEYSLHL